MWDAPHARHEDVVDAAQLDVDLEAEVGERLRRRLVHVLRLNTLRRKSAHDVTHALHFR